MKKEDISGLIIYMIIFAAAIIFGLTILQPYFANSTFKLGIIYALFILGAVAVGIVSSAVLLELGHIIGAGIGKYNIISVCILHLMFYKDEGKLKIKGSGYNGLTGETVIMPKDEKSNPRPYLLMGTILMSLWMAGCIVIFYFNKDYIRTFRSDLAYFFLTTGVTVAVCILYNIFPIKLDSTNDGYRLTMVSNVKNKEAYNELLRVEHEINQGKQDVEIKTFTELTNFTADLNMNKVYLLLDKKEYEEADKLLDLVLENEQNVSHKVYIRALAMKAFIAFVSKDKEEAIKYAEEHFNIELRKEFASDDSLVSIRAYMLIEGLVDNSKNECKLVLDRVYKAYKKTPKNRKENELKLFNEALDIIIQEHPKWEFEIYKLEA